MSGLGQVRLVARREISTRVRDKGFIISSLVIVLLVVGVMIFQLVAGGTSSSTTIGVVGDNGGFAQVLKQSGAAVGTDVTVTTLDDEAAARQAVEDGDVDAAVLDPAGDAPRVLVESADDAVASLVQSAITALSVSTQLADAGVDLPAVPPRYRSTYFHHVFGGGYAAAYYSYVWSEVLDADTVEWFGESGGLRPENGAHFRATVLSRGGSVDPMVAYREFRGRDADLGPLLRRRGLVEA